MTEFAKIKFGTSGWRAIMAEEFTFANVRRVVQAIATHIKAGPERPVIVGYDTRFLSPEFARTAADVLAANGLQVIFSRDFIPTPVISFQIRRLKTAGAINFTASHNPAEYNGIKFNTADGAPSNPDVTHEIERLANQDGETGRGEDKGKFPGPAVPQESIQTFDGRPSYLKALHRIIDAGALKKAKLKVGVDVLYGTGRGYLDEFLCEAGCRAEVLHNWRDVRFGGQSPEPALPQLNEMVKVMREKKLSAGFGTDGDADRFGVIDDDGTMLSPNEILPMVLRHLIKTRGWKGLVVRSVMTSHFIDAVARRHNLPLKETPVGFKYIAEAMLAGDFLMGGGV